MHRHFPTADVEAAINHERLRLEKAAWSQRYVMVGLTINQSGAGWSIKASVFHQADDDTWEELRAYASTLGECFEAAHRALPRAIKAVEKAREEAAA